MRREVGVGPTHPSSRASGFEPDRTIASSYRGDLEIESCASGGGRIDLEVMTRCDRVWASDCIDPLERQQIDRWTAQLLPPEMIGSHIASGRSHTTGRTHDLSFRAATAAFGHLGIEWDLAAATPDELGRAARVDRLVQGQPLAPAGRRRGARGPPRARRVPARRRHPGRRRLQPLPHRDPCGREPRPGRPARPRPGRRPPRAATAPFISRGAPGASTPPPPASDARPG